MTSLPESAQQHLQHIRQYPWNVDDPQVRQLTRLWEHVSMQRNELHDHRKLPTRLVHKIKAAHIYVCPEKIPHHMDDHSEWVHKAEVAVACALCTFEIIELSRAIAGVYNEVDLLDIWRDIWAWMSYLREGFVDKISCGDGVNGTQDTRCANYVQERRKAIFSAESALVFSFCRSAPRVWSLVYNTPEFHRGMIDTWMSNETPSPLRSRYARILATFRHVTTPQEHADKLCSLLSSESLEEGAETFSCSLLAYLRHSISIDNFEDLGNDMGILFMPLTPRITDPLIKYGALSVVSTIMAVPFARCLNEDATTGLDAAYRAGFVLIKTVLAALPSIRHVIQIIDGGLLSNMLRYTNPSQSLYHEETQVDIISTLTQLTVFRSVLRAIRAVCEGGELPDHPNTASAAFVGAWTLLKRQIRTRDRLRLILKQNPPHQKCGNSACKEEMELGKMKFCGGCMNIHYCSGRCSTSNWQHHRAHCRSWRRDDRTDSGSSPRPLRMHDRYFIESLARSDFLRLCTSVIQPLILEHRRKSSAPVRDDDGDPPLSESSERAAFCFRLDYRTTKGVEITRQDLTGTSAVQLAKYANYRRYPSESKLTSMLKIPVLRVEAIVATNISVKFSMM